MNLLSFKDASPLFMGTLLMCGRAEHDFKSNIAILTDPDACIEKAAAVNERPLANFNRLPHQKGSRHNPVRLNGQSA